MTKSTSDRLTIEGILKHPYLRGAEGLKDKWISTYGLDSTYASIHPILEDDSPDNAFSNVPYEKGFHLLTYFESLIGEDLFQSFLQTYILQLSQQSIITIELRQTWEQFIHDSLEGAKVN